MYRLNVKLGIGTNQFDAYIFGCTLNMRDLFAYGFLEVGNNKFKTEFLFELRLID